MKIFKKKIISKKQQKHFTFVEIQPNSRCGADGGGEKCEVRAG